MHISQKASWTQRRILREENYQSWCTKNLQHIVDINFDIKTKLRKFNLWEVFFLQNIELWAITKDLENVMIDLFHISIETLVICDLLRPKTFTTSYTENHFICGVRYQDTGDQVPLSSKGHQLRLPEDASARKAPRDFM